MMDKRVIANAGGDLSKVNLDPKWAARHGHAKAA